MSDRYIFVDPGVHEIYFAVFQGSDFVTAKPYRGLRHSMTAHLQAWKPDILIVEKPQVYQGGANRKGADPADLIDLACSVGACMAACARSYSVKPNHWKGQVPKEVHHARYEPRMTDAMRSCIAALPATLRHNLRDAICLGLWWQETKPLGTLGYECE